MTARFFGLAAVLLASISVTAQTPAPRTFIPDRFYNTFSFAHPPAMRIKPGERIVTKTADAAGVDGTASRSRKDPIHRPGPSSWKALSRATCWWYRSRRSSSIVPPATRAVCSRRTPSIRQRSWRASIASRAGQLAARQGQGTVRLDGADIAGLELRARPMLGCVGIAPARKEAWPPAHPDPSAATWTTPAWTRE